MSRQDVVIYDVFTGVVSSVADYNLSEDDARVLAKKLNDGRMVNNKAAIAAPAGELRRGSTVAIDPVPAPATVLPKPRKLTTVEQRAADCQCHMCGSPQLFTQTHCEKCNAIYNERRADGRERQRT